MHIYVSSQQLSFLQGTHGLPKKDQTICLKMRLYQDLAECNKCHHSIYLLNIPGSITFQNNDNVHLFWWESSQKQCVKRWFQFWFNDNTPKIPHMFFFFFFSVFPFAIKVWCSQDGHLRERKYQGLLHAGVVSLVRWPFRWDDLKKITPEVLKLKLLHDILLL